MLKVLFSNCIAVWGKVLPFNIIDPLKGSQRPHFKTINLEPWLSICLNMRIIWVTLSLSSRDLDSIRSGRPGHWYFINTS